MDGQLQRLIDLVLKAAPELWAIGMRQVWLDAIRQLVWVVLLAGATVACIALLARVWRTRDAWEYEGDAVAVAVVCGIGAAILGLAALLTLDSAAARLVNPQYYAIQVLLGLVR